MLHYWGKQRAYWGKCPSSYIVKKCPAVGWAESGSPKALQNDLSIKSSSSFIVEALELVCISSILDILSKASV
jgi:hypothetical protein